MKRKAGVPSLFALSTLVILGWAGQLAAEEDPSQLPTIWFGTEVSIAPDPDGQGIWNCEARLRDLGSGELLSAPRIVFAAGEEASVQSGLSPETVWELRVEVTDDGSEVKLSSRVTSGDQVLSDTTGRVNLTAE